MSFKERMKRALEAFWVFFKVGLFTFGGGLAMVSVISSEVVDRRGWLTEKEMGDVVIIAESTPGAIAVNTATYVGYKQAGVLGSILATLGAVVPSLAIISVIYVFFDIFKENVYIAAAFRGIRSAVIVLLVSAFIKLFRPMRKTWVTISVAVAVFLCTLFLDVNSFWYILAGGVVGAVTFAIISAKKKRKEPKNASTDDRDGRHDLEGSEGSEDKR